MKLIIPAFYTSYGRYIGRYRAHPLNIDALKISERRTLLGLYDVARDKLTKAAKVVGHVIGNYHPHGDTSTFGTLQQLVHQGFVVPQGNWGSVGLEDSNASAMRYVECKLESWVTELAFKYIKYVPWVSLEMDDEPLALPCPVPLGLVGYDLITGISFYKICIPKYTIKDLATRLIWLLEQNKESTDKGPCIKPNFRNCTSKEIEEDDYYKILTTGKGSIKAIPNGNIVGNKIHILGRAPGATFKSLVTAATYNDEKKSLELDIECKDLSGKKNPYDINILIEPRKKKNVDINELVKTIWTNYLVRNINFESIYSNTEDDTLVCGIDEILLNNYQYWKNAVLLSKVDEYKKANKKALDNYIIQLVRYLIQKYNCKTINSIIEQYKIEYPELINYSDNDCILENNNFKFIINNIKITDVLITDVISRKSIKNLIETEINIDLIKTEIENYKTNIINNDINCYDYLKQLS